MSYLIVVTGEPQVGKTSLIRCLAGVAFEPRHIIYDSPVEHTFEFQTSNGPISFRFLETNDVASVQRPSAIIHAFDVSSTFEPDWRGLAQNPPIFYVGTKRDLCENLRPESFFVETSALYGHGRENLMKVMVTKLTGIFGVTINTTV
jgi:hypothetical protein